MLFGPLLHPEILAALGKAGHHAKVLIADGNYPSSTAKGPNAVVVSLNLAPGLVTVNQVLQVLLAAKPFEAINTMGIPADDPYAGVGDPPVWNEYRQTIAAAGSPLQMQPISKWDFYEAVASRDHVLTIQTADQALWANLLLTVGVRQA